MARSARLFGIRVKTGCDAGSARERERIPSLRHRRRSRIRVAPDRDCTIRSAERRGFVDDGGGFAHYAIAFFEICRPRAPARATVAGELMTENARVIDVPAMRTSPLMQIAAADAHGADTQQGHPSRRSREPARRAIPPRAAGASSSPSGTKPSFTERLHRREPFRRSSEENLRDRPRRCETRAHRSPVVRRSRPGSAVAGRFGGLLERQAANCLHRNRNRLRRFRANDRAA